LQSIQPDAIHKIDLEIDLVIRIDFGHGSMSIRE
jgi:hypothetical protein